MKEYERNDGKNKKIKRKGNEIETNYNEERKKQTKLKGKR